MSGIDQSGRATAAGPPPLESAPSPLAAGTHSELPAESAVESRSWWIKLLVQPLLILAGGVLFLVALGVSQRLGWISAGGAGVMSAAVSAGDTRYICPMMCTLPQATPGRCPVCAMELVPATAGGGFSDPRAVRIDPAARRVANIRTVQVASLPRTRTIRAVGELRFDEGALKTISAYVDGRLERLFADYTGVVVTKGDPLALLYSPRLYASQVELLLARKNKDIGGRSALSRIDDASHDLYDSARQRLLELGMTSSQIEQLERAGEASSRLHLSAPISGTVIEKLAVEGSYVKEGDPIYKLADLSIVWLMLELFPDDVASVRYGQQVEAEVQSFPGRRFAGRVAFIDPTVNPRTRTVSVRVVIPNEDGSLRIGDYAKATVGIPLFNEPSSLVYDPELAGKWISPRHPQVIRDEAGVCPICGIALLPASHFGYSDQPISADAGLAVPRDAVLMAGNESVIYVETEPGRFEIRSVVLGPKSGDQIVIRSGIEAGEFVATRGNFLIDSQMQLAGNPSLIDPTRIHKGSEAEVVLAALAALPVEDRERATRQQICPVAGFPLGAMGTPLKVDVDGTPVFICCEGCRGKLLEEPQRYLAKLESHARDAARSTVDSAGPSLDNLPPIGVPQILESEDSRTPESVPEIRR